MNLTGEDDDFDNTTVSDDYWATNNNWEKPDSSTTDVYYVEVFIASCLYTYVSPVLLVAGIIGNALTVFVLAKNKIGNSSTSLLLIALAVADTLALVTGLVRYWIRVLAGVDVRARSHAACAVHKFCVYFFLDVAAWILVLVTFERLVSVIYPIKSKLLCTAERMAFALVIVVIALFVANCHILFAHGIIARNGVDVCAAVEFASGRDYVYFWRNIWTWIDMALLSGLPFLIMLPCNVTILLKVKYSRNARIRIWKKNTLPQAGGRVTSMTIMLLVVNLVFLLCTMPLALFMIAAEPVYSPHERAVRKLVFAVLVLLTYANNAANFWLYCFSGPKFRQFCLNMLKRDRRVHPTGGAGSSRSASRRSVASRASRAGSIASMLAVPKIPRLLPRPPSVVVNDIPPWERNSSVA
ncbi:sex peptide receptor-related protein 2-like [Tubulanus polymorphus]|uniref:sex peptide receptor-related protein 2-like n=1 Tax=Tubulanus polymorphus TaxID=672921 RepID=UPI003DA3B852